MRIYRVTGRYYAILAALATILALLISLPFATAYFRAYESQTIPSWMEAFAKASPDLFAFGARTRVYQICGRLYSLVIPLTIPALLALKSRIGTDTPILLQVTECVHRYRT